MMKNEILKFLKQDYLNNLDLIYALEHGAKIKYYNQAGIMLKFEDIYMLAFKDEKIAEQSLKQIDKCSMLAIHNDKYFVDHTLGIYPQGASNVPFTCLLYTSRCV